MTGRRPVGGVKVEPMCDQFLTIEAPQVDFEATIVQLDLHDDELSFNATKVRLFNSRGVAIFINQSCTKLIATY